MAAAVGAIEGRVPDLAARLFDLIVGPRGVELLLLALDPVGFADQLEKHWPELRGHGS